MAESAADLRKRIIKRLNMKTEEDKPQEFQILSLNEIKNRKKKFSSIENSSGDEERPTKTRKLSRLEESSDLSQVKIKTLEEIRSERAKKISEGPVSSSNEIGQETGGDHASNDSEVSSTCRFDLDIINNIPPSDETIKTHCVAKVQPTKRLKRKHSLDEIAINNVKSAKFLATDQSAEIMVADGRLDVPDSIPNSSPPKIESSSHSLPIDEFYCGSVGVENSDAQNELDTQKEIVAKKEFDVHEVDAEVMSADIKEISDESSPEKVTLDSSKLDEVLLLDEEEFESNDILKAEEDILKDIDELLNE